MLDITDKSIHVHIGTLGDPYIKVTWRFSKLGKVNIAVVTSITLPLLLPVTLSDLAIILWSEKSWEFVNHVSVIQTISADWKVLS